MTAVDAGFVAALVAARVEHGERETAVNASGYKRGYNGQRLFCRAHRARLQMQLQANA